MKRSNTKNSYPNWDIRDSIKAYDIDKWGGKYFSLNKRGNITVSPDGTQANNIDLLQLIKELKSREINPPLILRFNDILKNRITELNHVFEGAIKNYKYNNQYKGVFPIKCNHQKTFIEKILEFGDPWDFGLEVGSKSELIIGLSLLDNPNSLLICNGYKDNNYIEMSILARKLGKKPILVIEQIDEIPRIIECVNKLGDTPLLGIRTKLSSRSSGRWENTTGDSSKFGLSIPEIMITIKELEQANLLRELQLLHFHIGSQISDISIIKDALQEASQVFVELCKLGAPMKYIDVGGGLGIDYDGSQTTSSNSTNYTLQNYANDVVATIKDSCKIHKIDEPIIISESGRSITSHCSVLIFNILGTSNINYTIDKNFNNSNESLIISNLLQTLEEIKELDDTEEDYSKIIELWNDAKKFKNDSLATFRLGFMSLEERAFSEQVTWACAKEITNKLNVENINCPELSDIKDTLASTYYGNFSVFKSIPDSWAINQIFPIVPIHRHLEQPIFNGTFADLTCDSDGKLNNFIDNGNSKSLLKMHSFNNEEDYFIGIFLSGAYQEALGNLHNLFGSTNIIHIDITENNNYKISNIIREDNKAEVLKKFDYNTEELIEKIRVHSELAINANKLSIEETRQLIDHIESSLRKSTYLSE